MTSLGISAVDVDEFVTGTRIVVADMQRVAQLIALVLMGQAAHAQEIIATAGPVRRHIDTEALRADAMRRLHVTSEAVRAHRDGLLLEMLSWIAANESVDGECLLKDPHLAATTPGLDGLMIDLGPGAREVRRVIIFEDKCSGDPREAFRDKTLPAFREIHAGARASELLASTVALMRQAGLTGEGATMAAAVSQDPARRTYRAGLAVGPQHDSTEARAALFSGFESLQDLPREQRVGASYVTTGGLRVWFDHLASCVANEIRAGAVDV